MTGVPEYLESWLVGQRWFGGKRRAPRLDLIGGFGLVDPTGAAAIRVHLVLDHAEYPLLYQVPLTERRAPLPGAENALVAKTDAADGTRYVYDGAHDPAYAEALIRLILDNGVAKEPSGTSASDGSGGNSGGIVVARGHRAPGVEPVSIRSSRVLRGEQSNTSIVYETVDRNGEPSIPLICKLFRTLHDGENPDVVLTEVLGSSGSRVAPQPIGHVSAQWRDSGTPSGVARGHLAFAQEFLPNVEDAWRIAVRSVERGEDFTAQAHALGAITAEMHGTLATALPSRTTTPSDIAATIDSMRSRFEIAAKEVPSLGEHRAALDYVYERAAASRWPALQRIHGDFHLGQVLSVPDRGWVVLDFEGEPLRPMRERSLPDIPLRDIAGMLRSFDYAVGSVELAHPGLATEAWASACRQAFLDGYIERSGRDVRELGVVLDAFEIDKALYEAVYEARTRPGWLAIPLGGIGRLLEHSTLA